MSETITIAITSAPDFIGTLDAVRAALHINDLRSLEDVPRSFFAFSRFA